MGSDWQQIKLLRIIAGATAPESPRRLDIEPKRYYVECSICGYDGGYPPLVVGELALTSYECYYCKKPAWKILMEVKKKK